MDNTSYGSASTTTSKKIAVKATLITFGFAFLIIGLGITIGIIYGIYTIAVQPEPLSWLFTYIGVGDDVFIKWVINDQADEITFSRILMMAFIAIAASVVVHAILHFITLCITSGKGILSLSRNFDD